VLDADTTGLEKVVDSYVDKGEANPEANCKELISGIEVGEGGSRVGSAGQGRQGRCSD
jgi:hypothetical protein